VDIIEETVSRIRLSNEELILFKNILDKINLVFISELNKKESDFLLILNKRVNGRIEMLDLI